MVIYPGSSLVYASNKSSANLYWQSLVSHICPAPINFCLVIRKYSQNDFYHPTNFSDNWLSISDESQILFNAIKVFSNKEISRLIDSTPAISDYIFSWIGAFDEPYCSSWLYHYGKLTGDTKIPYSVTTWSWRTKWIFTVVIKPA